MTFDPRSLDRLRSLGRQLPQELPKPILSKNNEPNSKDKLHPIETEKNPQALFKELIKNNDLILVKGSNGMHLSKITQAINLHFKTLEKNHLLSRNTSKI